MGSQNKRAEFFMTNRSRMSIEKREIERYDAGGESTSEQHEERRDKKPAALLVSLV